MLSTLKLYSRYGKPESEPINCDDGKALSNRVLVRAFFETWFGV